MKDILEFAKQFARDNKVAFSHDRSKTVGASEIGQCIRKTVYGKLKTPMDDGYVDENGFATRGNVMEDAYTAPLIRAWCQANGGELLWSGQSDQISLVGENVPLSVTPDGLAINMPRDILLPWGIEDIGEDRSFVVEMKSISPRYRKENLPKAAHVPQTLAQIGMVRSATEHKPDGGIIVYVEADDFWNLNIFPVPFDEKAFKALVRRADLILKTRDPNKVPPEGKMKGGGDCGECPFARACLGYVPYTFDDPKALPEKETVKVAKVAAKVKKLEVKADRAKKALTMAEGELILKLGEVKRNFVKGSGFTAHLKRTSPQNRTDAKKLAALAQSLGATQAQLDECKTLTKEGVSLSVEHAK